MMVGCNESSTHLVSHPSCTQWATAGGIPLYIIFPRVSLSASCWHLSIFPSGVTFIRVIFSSFILPNVAFNRVMLSAFIYFISSLFITNFSVTSECEQVVFAFMKCYLFSSVYPYFQRLDSTFYLLAYCSPFCDPCIWLHFPTPNPQLSPHSSVLSNDSIHPICSDCNIVRSGFSRLCKPSFR